MLVLNHYLDSRDCDSTDEDIAYEVDVDGVGAGTVESNIRGVGRHRYNSTARSTSTPGRASTARAVRGLFNTPNQHRRQPTQEAQDNESITRMSPRPQTAADDGNGLGSLERYGYSARHQYQHSPAIKRDPDAKAAVDRARALADIKNDAVNDRYFRKRRDPHHHAPSPSSRSHYQQHEHYYDAPEGDLYGRSDGSGGAEHSTPSQMDRSFGSGAGGSGGGGGGGGDMAARFARIQRQLGDQTEAAA